MNLCRLLLAVVSLVGLLYAAENEVKPDAPPQIVPTIQSLRAELTSLEEARTALLRELNERYAAAEPAARTTLEAELNRVQIEQEIAVQTLLIEYYDLLGRDELATKATDKLANLQQQAAAAGLAIPATPAAKETNDVR